MNLDDRRIYSSYGISQRHRRVAVAAGIENHAVGVGLLKTVDKLSLAVALEIFDDDVGKTPAKAVENLPKGCSAVKFRLAPARRLRLGPLRMSIFMPDSCFRQNYKKPGGLHRPPGNFFNLKSITMKKHSANIVTTSLEHGDRQKGSGMRKKFRCFSLFLCSTKEPRL